MTDTLILGGTPVPPLADEAVVFEENRGTHSWCRLVRCAQVGHYRLEYLVRRWTRETGWTDQWLVAGGIQPLADRQWRAHCGYNMSVYRGENLDEALAALWAAREASS